MNVRIHLPTLLLTLGVAVLIAALLQTPRAAAEERPIRCDRYDIVARERQDWEEFAENQRAQTEQVLTKLHEDGYSEILWSDSYLTRYVAGEGHYVGFVCMAKR